jgi:hypothetical protein
MPTPALTGVDIASEPHGEPALESFRLDIKNHSLPHFGISVASPILQIVPEYTVVR